MDENKKVKILIRREMFTNRECDVLRLIIKGKSNTEISKILNISENTVKKYASAIFQKVGVQNRVQAAVSAVMAEFV